jgi:hypothetical protein
MSVRTMSLVFEYDMPELKTDDGKTVPDSTAKFVLLALADHASDEGEGAYPGVKRICKKTSMSTQTVCNALNALRHNGYTTKEGKSKFDTNNYTINLAKLQPLESSNSSRKNRKQGTKIPPARVKPSFNQPETTPSNEGASATPNAPAQPKAQDFPSNVLFREVVGRWPAKGMWHKILHSVSLVEKRLLRPATKEDLQPFYEEWLERGYMQTSFKWLTEWAVSGVIPSNGKKTTFNVGDALRSMMQEEPAYGNA